MSRMQKHSDAAAPKGSAWKKNVIFALVVLALAVFGISSLMGLRLELMPDMDMPMQHFRHAKPYLIICHGLSL